MTRFGQVVAMVVCVLAHMFLFISEISAGGPIAIIDYFDCGTSTGPILVSKDGVPDISKCSLIPNTEKIPKGSLNGSGWSMTIACPDEKVVQGAAVTASVTVLFGQKEAQRTIVHSEPTCRVLANRMLPKASAETIDFQVARSELVCEGEDGVLLVVTSSRIAALRGSCRMEKAQKDHPRMKYLYCPLEEGKREGKKEVIPLMWELVIHGPQDLRVEQISPGSCLERSYSQLRGPVL